MKIYNQLHETGAALAVLKNLNQTKIKTLFSNLQLAIQYHPTLKGPGRGVPTVCSYKYILKEQTFLPIPSKFHENRSIQRRDIQF